MSLHFQQSHNDAPGGQKVNTIMHFFFGNNSTLKTFFQTLEQINEQHDRTQALVQNCQQDENGRSIINNTVKALYDEDDEKNKSYQKIRFSVNGRIYEADINVNTIQYASNIRKYLQDINNITDQRVQNIVTQDLTTINNALTKFVFQKNNKTP